MTVSFDDVELIARLEVDNIIQQNNLRKLMEFSEGALGLFVEDEITKCFLEGVRFGLTVDENTPYTILERELEVLKNNYRIDSDDLVKVMGREELSEMFAMFFVNGMEWVMTHKSLNNEF